MKRQQSTVGYVHLLVCVRHAEPLANVTAVVLIIHVLVHLIDTWH
jgi:hypothetical protein